METRTFAERLDEAGRSIDSKIKPSMRTKGAPSTTQEGDKMDSQWAKFVLKRVAQGLPLRGDSFTEALSTWQTLGTERDPKLPQSITMAYKSVEQQFRAVVNVAKQSGLENNGNFKAGVHFHPRTKDPNKVRKTRVTKGEAAANPVTA